MKSVSFLSTGRSVMGLFCVGLLLHCNAPEQNPATLEQKEFATHVNQSNETLNAGIISQRIPPEPITFTKYEYFDRQASMPAFTVLIPKGWKVAGGIAWTANHSLPATSNFRFYNPNGSEEFFIFPTQSYFWTNNPLFLTTNPPGSLRFGTPVAQPVRLNAAFNHLVLNQYRKSAMDIQVRREENLPELARLACGSPEPGLKAYADAGKFRITYTENGKPKEEEMFTAVSQFIINLPGSMTTPGYFINYWYVDFIFSCRANFGKLDESASLFKTIIYSFDLNKTWYGKVVNVKNMLAQDIMQGIRKIGEIGTYIARSGSEMRENELNRWYAQQKIRDKISQNFSDVYRGIERYYDPFAEKEIELSNRYNYAWTNNLGEYYLTDSPSDNPNIGSNLTWQLMERQE